MSPKDQLKNIYRFLSKRHLTLHSEYKVDFKPRYTPETKPHPELYEIVNANRSVYQDLIDEMLKLKEKIHEIQPKSIESDLTKPYWNNGYLPGLDIIGLYTLIAKVKPKKYLEIGSGHSTKVVKKAIKDFNLDTKIISIDPCPRADINEISDEVIREPFENTNYDIISTLGENDILFIDNSHRILPNSDSMVFYMEVLPKLKKGVYVHVHDIYIPFDYPQFMCDRFYSEQYGLAMYILADAERYNTILPAYFIAEDKELSEQLMEIWNHPNLKDVERHGGSYWLRIDK